MPVQTSPRARGRVGLLVVVWALAVPVAAALGVLALRSAGADSSATVLSAAEAAALSSASPTVSSGSPSTPMPPGDSPVVERRVPGAVLGLRCEETRPVLVWSVPDTGWRVEQVEPEDGGLQVQLEADDDEVRVTIVCAGGTPEVVEATRGEE